MIIIIILIFGLNYTWGACESATVTSLLHPVIASIEGDYSSVVIINSGNDAVDSYLYSDDADCNLDVFSCEIQTHNFVDATPTCTATRDGDKVNYSVGPFSYGFEASVRVFAGFSVSSSTDPAFSSDVSFAWPCTALQFATTSVIATVYFNEGKALDPAALGNMENADHAICGIQSYVYDIGSYDVTIGSEVYPENKVVTVSNSPVFITITAVSKTGVESSNSLTLGVSPVNRIGTLGSLPIETGIPENSTYQVYQFAKDEARIISFNDFSFAEIDGEPITDYYEIIQYTTERHGISSYPDYLTDATYNHSLLISVETLGPCSGLSDCSAVKLVGNHVVFQYTKILVVVQDKISGEQATQYVTFFKFQVLAWVVNNDLKDSTKDWSERVQIQAGAPTTGCTPNTITCGIVKYMPVLFDTPSDYCITGLVGGSPHNDQRQDSGGDICQVAIDTTTEIRQVSYRLHSHLYQSLTITKTYYSHKDIGIDIICGLESLATKDGASSFTLVTGPALAQQAQVYGAFDGWTSSVGVCPLKYFFLCDACTDTTADGVVQIEPYISANLQLNDAAQVQYLYDGTSFKKELTLLAATSSHETDKSKEVKADFTYVMCGTETIEVITEEAFDYLVLEASSDPIVLPFADLILAFFTVTIGPESHDDCLARSTVTVLPGDCLPGTDVDPLISVVLDSDGNVASMNQDISGYTPRTALCVEVKTLGLKTAYKKMVYEICGEPIETGPSDLEFTPIAIDGSPLKYIFKSEWEAFFDNPATNCSIVKYDFFEASSQVEDGVVVFDYTDAANFQANSNSIFKIEDGTELVDQIELQMLLAPFLKMQKGDELKLQRYVRATTVSGFIFAQPVLFTFVKTVDFPPYYSSFPYDTIQIKVYQANQLKFKFKSYSYTLPTALDYEGGDIQVSLEQDREVPWIELLEGEDEQYVIRIKDNLITARDHGDNKFKINLKNPNESPQAYKMTVRIIYKEADLEKELGISADEEEEAGGDEAAADRGHGDSALEMAIEQIDVSHSFVLTFTAPVEIDPTKNIGDSIKFTSISGEDGSVAVGSFSGSQSARRLESVEVARTKEFSWFISTQEESRLTIQLEFADKLSVSASSLDEVRMDIQDPAIFHSLTGFPLQMEAVKGSCSIPGVLFCQTVPPFLSLETKQQLQATATLYEGSLKSLTAGNVFIVIFFGGTLQHLWGVIRPLQHLSTLGLISIIYPGNLFQFFSEMVDIANMDVLFGQQINEYLFTFVDMNPFNDFFETFGIETNNLMLNTGSIIIPLVPLLILQYSLYKAFKRIGSEHYRYPSIRRLDLKTEGMKIDIRSALLTLVTEGYIELSMACFLNIYSLFYISSWAQAWNRMQVFGEALQMILTMVVLVLIVGIPSYLSYALFSKGKWEKLQFSEPVTEVFFSRVKMKRASTAFYEVSIMLLKMTTCFLLLAESHLPLMQLFMIFIAQFTHLSYLFWVNPFEDELTNTMEKFDQLTIFLVLYPFIVMTNMSLDLEFKERCGWFVILSISFNIFVNLSASIYRLFLDFRLDHIKEKAEKKKFELMKSHIINRKRIISQFPGQFPEFEAFVEFNLEKVRFSSWVKERAFLLSRGINFSKLPEEIEFQKMIRKFDLPRAKLFETKKRKRLAMMETKQKNRSRKLKQERIYNRLKEYQLRTDEQVDGQGGRWITPRRTEKMQEARAALQTDRSTARIPLEIIDEVESEAEVVNPFEVNAKLALTADLERLKSLGLALADSKILDGKAQILGAIAAELQEPGDACLEVSDFVSKSKGKLTIINPLSYREQEEAFIEKNELLAAHQRFDKVRPLFVTTLPVGLFIKNLGKQAGTSKEAIACKASLAIVAGLGPLHEIRSYFAHYSWFSKTKDKAPWSKKLMNLWRDLGSVPYSLFLNRQNEVAIDVTEPLETLVWALIKMKIKALSPVSVWSKMRKETASEMNFLDADTLKYSKAQPYEFLSQINRLDRKLLKDQERQTIMAYHLEPVSFFSRCFGRLEKMQVTCSKCERLLQTEYEVGYKINILPDSGTVEAGITAHFSGAGTEPPELSCSGCHSKKTTVVRKVASPPFYLFVDTKIFDKQGQRRVPRTEIGFEDLYLKLPKANLGDWEENRVQVADLVEESKLKPRYSLEKAEEHVIDTVLRTSGDYELVSVVCHKGRSTFDGQYYTFSKDPTSSEWYETIESWCTPVARIEKALAAEKLNIVCCIYRALAPASQALAQSRKTNKIYH